MDEEYLFFEEDDRVRDLVVPPYSEVQKILFGISYFFANIWNNTMLDIANHGYTIVDKELTPMMMFDAIDAGIIMPIYVQSPENADRMIFKFWNPLEQIYCDIDEMDLEDFYWFTVILNNGIWSYN